MGIINVTPDSFYDGGRYHTVELAVKHAGELHDQGAVIIDIGGASSRPGADEVDPLEEARRVLPVIHAVAGNFSGPVSIDTTWSAVAEEALDAGASWVNDISAGRFDPGMIPLVARRRCKIILMHSRHTPKTMQLAPRYGDVVAEVTQELLDAAASFQKGGVSREQILLDPGIGFGKTVEHNLELIRRIDVIVSTGYPVVIGTSRKSFIGAVTGRDVDKRLYGTLGSVAVAWQKGVAIFRVHDVAATNDFLKVVTAINRTRI
jgi:dihydropteroate synthase